MPFNEYTDDFKRKILFGHWRKLDENFVWPIIDPTEEVQDGSQVQSLKNTYQKRSRLVALASVILVNKEKIREIEEQMKKYMQALNRRVNKKVKKIFDRSYKPHLNKKSNPPDCLENKEVHQAIQKEINELMNPEDTKMSTEEKTEYEK